MSERGVLWQNSLPTHNGGSGMPNLSDGPPISDTRSVLTVKELAEYLKVHPSSIYRLLSKGELPTFKVGTDWRLEREKLQSRELPDDPVEERTQPGGARVPSTKLCVYSLGPADDRGPGPLVQATNGDFYRATSYGGSSAYGYFDVGLCGSVFSLAVGMKPFVETLPTFGKVEAGQNPGKQSDRNHQRHLQRHAGRLETASLAERLDYADLQNLLRGLWHWTS
jgi:excisionase family DNA binding protein